MGEQLLAVRINCCICSNPGTHGLITLHIEHSTVDVGSACSHPVCGQRAGLVRADGGRGAHRLTRVEGLDQVILARHLVGRKCEGDDEGERQTFRNRTGEDTDGLQKDVHELLVICALVYTILPNEDGDHCSEGANHANFSDARGHGVELAIQGRQFSTSPTIYALLDLASNAILANCNHKHSAFAGVDRRARDHERLFSRL
mmetsp:Transcript_96909/g.313215  ORF Transcript_96909/g.313215 Transcript_96909/m.313215 type:complete len:202 (-) Transcript_96909:124-729(-)